MTAATDTILITGARKGIGRGIAEYFLEAGWRVIGCSRQKSDLQHKHYSHYTLDVASEKDVTALFKSIRQNYEKLYALINNAGISRMNPALLTPAAAFGQIMGTNVTGTFLCCREAAKLMQRHKSGRIINLSSVAVPLALPGETAYAASKAAVENLTRTLAAELAPLGITVNALGPAPVKTDLIKNVPRETMEKLVSRQLLPRYAERKDITNAIDFFLSPASDFITAQTIYLGGISK